MATHADSMSGLEIWAARGRNLVRNAVFQRIAFIIAAAVFVGGVWFSWRARPDLFSDLSWGLLSLIAFVFCPLILTINASIFRMTARIGGVGFSFVEALRLTVFSSALNHLPAPGGPMLRVAAMRERGGKLMTAGAVNMASGLLWVGITFLYAGVSAFLFAPLLGAVCLVGGGLAFGLGVVMCLRVRGRAADIAFLAGLNAANVVIYAVALWVAFLALGAPTPLAGANVISAAVVAGSAVSFVPGGIGVREATGAFLASRIAIDPSAAFAATAVVHMAMVTLLALSAGAFAFTGKSKNGGASDAKNTEQAPL